MDLDEEIEGVSIEQMAEFCDALAELQLPVLGRNDLCLCGSGKKYKKCCLNKDKNQNSLAEVYLESFQVTRDALTPEESKEHFSPLSEEDEELMSVLHHNLKEHPEMIDSENCDYFKKMEILRIKYPENPKILNFIANGYQYLGLEDKLKKLIFYTYEKFPDYLFARLGVASIYLKDKLAEKAFKVLNEAYTLKTLYPDRDVFHISEYRAFGYFIVEYCCQIDDLRQAEIHLQCMESILDEDDDLLQFSKKTLRRTKGIQRFKAGYYRFFQLAEKQRIK